MRKILCLFLVFTLMCSLGACENDDTIVQDPEINTELPVETENDTITMTKILEQQGAVTYYWTDVKNYEYAITSIGFPEVCFNLGHNNYRFKSVTLGKDKFKMVFDWKYVDDETQEETWQENWTLYGAKTDVNCNISDISASDYDACSGWDYAEEYGQDFSGGYYERMDCFFFDVKEENGAEILDNVVINAAIYYPETQNVYNIMKEYGEDPLKYPTPPVVFESRDLAKLVARDNMQSSIVDSHVIATADFTIKYGDNEETYRFRKGMSLLTWAASEYNTGGWVVGYNDGIFSPDFNYVIWAGNGNMEFMLENGVIVAEKNESEIVPPEAMQHMLAQQTTMHTTVHLVNAQTPLLSPGVKIISRHNTMGDYGVFNLGSLYETDETLQIYLKNVPDDVLSEIKLYAFMEPLGIREIIHESGYTNHRAPLAKDDPILVIPQDATCIDFKRVEDSIMEREDGTTYVKDENVVVAEYDMTADPNFTIYNEKAFVITYKDQIVYWIHMPIFLDDYEREDLIVVLDGNMTDEEIEQFIAEKEKEWREQQGHPEEE